MPYKKTIVITGASSGLGYEIAKQYAQPNARLILISRNSECLKELAALCTSKGAETLIEVIDVREKERMHEFLVKICNQYGIDIILACAGVSAGTLDGPETPAQIEIIFNTNINGVLNTIMPVIPHMIARREGNIVIISSMAGLIGLSSAPSYSASKACVRVFGEALRGYLKQYNINTIVVIPSYIKTPMTEVNSFPMPLMVSAEKAARIIIKGIAKKKGIIAFPLVIYFIVKFLTCLPNQLISCINSKIPGKPAFTNNHEHSYEHEK